VLTPRSSGAAAACSSLPQIALSCAGIRHQTADCVTSLPIEQRMTSIVPGVGRSNAETLLVPAAGAPAAMAASSCAISLASEYDFFAPPFLFLCPFARAMPLDQSESVRRRLRLACRSA